MAKIAMGKINWDQEPVLREKLFFGLALLALLYLFLSYFWTPLSDRVDLARGEAKGVSVQTDGLRKLIDLTKEQMTKISGEPKQKAAVDERVKRILARRVGSVTDEINATVDLLASRNFARRVKVRRVDMGERAETPNYIAVPLMIELEGPFTGIQGYLDAMERLERPIVVQKFSIQPDKERTSSLVTAIDAELYIPKR